MNPWFVLSRDCAIFLFALFLVSCASAGGLVLRDVFSLELGVKFFSRSFRGALLGMTFCLL